ncbi:YpiF family protein [Lederbergia sp. NSJ-179]|uniref:YpiF family protein n=1 Tax=Lederbergia sp. NSJ-179 TaxID=2931402 RepID=UPI001FD2BBDE|nr:YpiF family protein [Lederbergia sp. NSJ-179]MCJ7839466.1 YpiF family protein [Lederbergia sp. NSJ-179]
MKWNVKDIELFMSEKEYVDTALIPLVSVQFDTHMKRAAEQGEFIQLLSMHLERQFKGRMVLLPSFAYVQEPEEELDLLMKWKQNAKAGGFTNVFFLTADKRWNTLVEESMASLFYVPSIPLEHLEEKYKHAAMEDQLKTLIPKMIKNWG